MSKTALILVADGSEEMETVTPIDVLRRAGVTVTVAGLESSKAVICSRQVGLVPDASLDVAISDNKTYDIVILPGGLKGAEAFCESKSLGELLKSQESSGRHIASICAAPTALKSHGIFTGKQLTSYPSVKEKLADTYEYLEDRVVIDGKLITSRGPGTAVEFALAIVTALVGKDKAVEVAKGMLVEGY